ncbi:MAG: response regulator transcription factor [Candidatus Promineifilaceae bacterium]
MTIRVIIADDQPKVRFALRVLLESKQDVEIVGEVDEARELVAQVKNASPSVLILDWLLPGLPEIGSIASLRNVCPDIFIVALSGRPELGQEALRDGADAFVSKIDPPDRLLAALGQYNNRQFSSGVPEENASYGECRQER